jgi:pyridoxal/pyridoxine/pyridoxamine kinase
MKQVTDSMANELTRAIVNYQYGALSREQLLESIGSRVATSAQHLQTQFDTALSGYFQDSANALAIENGYDSFRASGPNDDRIRPFCEHIMNDPERIYSREEIDAMDNDQGLPVFQYFGGYNCRHQWIAVRPNE